MLQPGVRQRVRVSRQGGRRAPVEYAEAVEQWAREHGGHARLQWLEAPMNCWCVKLSYRLGDPRQASNTDGEPVLLHEYWTAEQWQKRKPHLVRRHPRSNAVMAGNYAFELDELGVEGLKKWLDRGNILSGRGQFTSVEEAGKVQADRHESAMERLRATKRDNAKHRALDIRRSVYKIPFFRVGVSFDRGGKLTKEND